MSFFPAFPELKELMGIESTHAFEVLVKAGVEAERSAAKAALAECFRNLIHGMKDNSARVANSLDSLLRRLDKGGKFDC